ncbi:hypothetical protein DXH95_00850 [Sphingorhabdus pulchriflava]|uniref:Uncharacterized protein n=1 Tax=Sphingorhabdus pulchriflava TaxID=2292257 RepID=A0A371BEN1_9SPHN|nr:hypothetical protein [Sphingorhabdus pulchriflava]RDV06034.1 hypothetical protein DXH95_00850 [Sphingorhabdus pulchriflava]
MNGSVTPCNLGKALIALLPEAEMLSRKTQAWHSATFSGERVVLTMKLSGANCRSRAAAFATALPDTEFALRRQLVADIAVCKTVIEDQSILLTIEALLLDD